MSKIQKRGRLIAGVSADTLLLGARNPISGKIEGFDIDMLHAISQAIFGDPNKIELRVITAADRLPVLQKGTVDIVARNMTINCDALEGHRLLQRVLPVRAEGPRPARREGRGGWPGHPDAGPRRARRSAHPTARPAWRSCAPSRASSRSEPTRTPGASCSSRRASVDAITGDDTVLAGLAAQDPYAEVVDAPAFTAEPYGLGVNKANVDFVRFINGVLEDMRSNGQWTRNYNTWLAEALGQAPAPPKPVYGRAP